ncbi:MAG: CHASE3 domain-containing protein [Ferruginibacter sp.]
MKISILHKFLLFSFIILGSIGFLAIATYKSNQKLHVSEILLDHTKQVIYLSGDILTLVKEVEIITQDFVIRNDSTSPEHLISTTPIFTNIKQLKLLTTDNPAQQLRIDSLSVNVQKYLDFAFKKSRSAADQADTIAGNTARTGRKYTDYIRKIANEIQQDEYNLLQQRKQINERSLQVFNRFSVIIFILIFLFTILVLLSAGNFLIQNKDKEKRAADLVIANQELLFQNAEKEKRAAELIIANTELAFQNQEKEKRAAELLDAIKELAYQNEEKRKRAEELIITIEELAFQNREKEKGAAELSIANNELIKTEEYLKEYILGLEEMMFMTSHNVRHPVANILGLSNLLDQSIHLPERLKQLIDYIKQAALSLDIFTRELTTFMSELEKKGKNKTRV